MALTVCTCFTKKGACMEDHPSYVVVNNHADRKSPKDRVVGPLPNGLSKWMGCSSK